MPNPNEYLAKKSLLDTKQDLLTAGANITIDNNNVISAAGGTEVEANPQDPATDTLTTIDIDGTVYDIAGSGGSSVIPNPSDPPTDTLDSIEIDGDIFSVGSGNADYVELTQQEYDALTPEEKMNGTIYFITDGEGGGGGSARSLAGLDWANKVTVTTSVIAPQASITYTPPKGGVLIVSGYGESLNMQLLISSSSTEDFYAPLLNQAYTSSEFIVNGNEELTISNGSSRATIGDLAIYFVPFLGGGGSNLVHYSADEHIVGTDVDGATIYEQTFTPDTLPALSNTGQTRAINTGLTGIEQIWVESNSLCSNNMPFPYLHYSTNNVVGYFWNINGGNPILCVRAGQDSSNITIIKLTVRYKKSIV